MIHAWPCWLKLFDNWYLTVSYRPVDHIADRGVKETLLVPCIDYTHCTTIYNTASIDIGETGNYTIHGCLSEGTRGHTNTQLVITRHIGYYWHTPFGISEALQYLWHQCNKVRSEFIILEENQLRIWVCGYYWVFKSHNLVLISWEPESSGGLKTLTTLTGLGRQKRRANHTPLPPEARWQIHRAQGP